MARIPFINITFFIFISSSFLASALYRRPDLDDLEFMAGSYELNQSNINYFEKKLGRKFDLKKYVYDFARYDFEGKLIN
jgi:hypothetical protein